MSPSQSTAIVRRWLPLAAAANSKIRFLVDVIEVSLDKFYII